VHGPVGDLATWRKITKIVRCHSLVEVHRRVLIDWDEPYVFEHTPAKEDVLPSRHDQRATQAMAFRLHVALFPQPAHQPFAVRGLLVRVDGVVRCACNRVCRKRDAVH